MNLKTNVTRIIIFTNIFLYVLGLIITRTENVLFMGTTIPRRINLIHEYGVQIGSDIAAGQYWRLFTSIFLHANLMHLAFNCYFLFVCGEMVERIYGKLRFFIIYMLTGLAGNILSYFLLPLNVRSLGASGACLGLGGILVVLLLDEKANFRRYFNNIWTFVGIIMFNVFYGFLFADLNINNWAHLGGFLMGIVIGLYYSVKFRIQLQRD